MMYSYRSKIKWEPISWSSDRPCHLLSHTRETWRKLRNRRKLNGYYGSITYNMKTPLVVEVKSVVLIWSRSPYISVWMVRVARLNVGLHPVPPSTHPTKLAQHGVWWMIIIKFLRRLAKMLPKSSLVLARLVLGEPVRFFFHGSSKQ